MYVCMYLYANKEHGQFIYVFHGITTHWGMEHQVAGMEVRITSFFTVGVVTAGFCAVIFRYFDFVIDNHLCKQ